MIVRRGQAAIPRVGRLGRHIQVHVRSAQQRVLRHIDHRVTRHHRGAVQARERLRAHSRQVDRQHQAEQRRVGQRAVAQHLGRIRQMDGLQRGAAVECARTHRGYTVGQVHGHDAGLACEGAFRHRADLVAHAVQDAVIGHLHRGRGCVVVGAAIPAHGQRVVIQQLEGETAAFRRLDLVARLGGCLEVREACRFPSTAIAVIGQHHSGGFDDRRVERGHIGVNGGVLLAGIDGGGRVERGVHHDVDHVALGHDGAQGGIAPEGTFRNVRGACSDGYAGVDARGRGQQRIHVRGI